MTAPEKHCPHMSSEVCTICRRLAAAEAMLQNVIDFIGVDGVVLPQYEWKANSLCGRICRLLFGKI